MDIAIKVIPIAFSSIALVISVATFVTRQKQDRRDLFLKMHERLVDPDIQLGRRLLFERIESVENAATMRAENATEYQLINRSLAMFDILAMYVERGFIDESLALEEWGHSFARTFRQAQPFIADRLAIQKWRAWPHLHGFAEVATKWHDTQQAE